MLNIRSNVISIDYPATFHTLYPFISEHFKESDKHNFLRSFIIELGDNAEKVFASLLEYLDETQRKELIIGLVNRNSTRLIKLLNDKLKDNEIGKCIEADSLGMCMAGDDLIIDMNNIKINIPGLVDAISQKKKPNPIISTSLKAMSRLGSDFVERKGVEIISNSDEIKAEIINTFQNALTSKGIAVTIGGIDITYVQKQDMLVIDSQTSDKVINGEFEEIIIKALVNYLVDNAGKKGA